MSQAGDSKLTSSFKAMITMQMPKRNSDPNGCWYFNEVLDQLLFYYIVGKKVWKEIKRKGLRVDTVLAKMKRKKIY